MKYDNLSRRYDQVMGEREGESKKVQSEKF